MVDKLAKLEPYMGRAKLVLSDADVIAIITARRRGVALRHIARELGHVSASNVYTNIGIWAIHNCTCKVPK